MISKTLTKKAKISTKTVSTKTPAEHEEILKALAQLNSALNAQKNSNIEETLKNLRNSLRGESLQESSAIDPLLLKAIASHPARHLKTPSICQPEALWAMNTKQFQLTNSGEVIARTNSTVLNEAIDKVSKKSPAEFVKKVSDISKLCVESPYGFKSLITRDLEYAAWNLLAYMELQTEESKKAKQEATPFKETHLIQDGWAEIQTKKEALLNTCTPTLETVKTVQRITKSKDLTLVSESAKSRADALFTQPPSTKTALLLAYQLTQNALANHSNPAVRTDADVCALLTSLHFEGTKTARKEGNPFDRILPVPASSKRGLLFVQYPLSQTSQVTTLTFGLPTDPSYQNTSHTQKTLRDRFYNACLQATSSLKKVRNFSKDQWQSFCTPIVIGLVVGIIATILATQVLLKQNKPNAANAPSQNEQSE